MVLFLQCVEMSTKRQIFVTERVIFEQREYCVFGWIKLCRGIKVVYDDQLDEVDRVDLNAIISI